MAKRSVVVKVVSNYKITKSESYSQHGCLRKCKLAELYLITKLQNLKAIHNADVCTVCADDVVSNYKITKSESYSQY